MVAHKKSLVIVESPGKVKTIAKVLGREYVVKASVGHVRDLTKSRKGEKKDSIVLGVAKDFTPSYTEVPARKKVLDDLRKAVLTVEKVYLCPDPDREGEAIAWHLKEALKLADKRTFRVTFDEITPRGIRAAFQNPRKIDMDLVYAQQARRVLDRIVGYKLSPLLWDKIGRGLSAGRVQSVALRLIVEREREIDIFKAEEYWTVTGRFAFDGKPFDGELRALEGRQVVASADDLAKFKGQDTRQSASGVLRTLLASEVEAQDLAALLEKAAYEVRGYDVKEVSDRPYPPFATSQLQQAAANRLGFDARRTMRVAQQLYEGVPLGEEGPVALITYMRTDSFRIAQDAVQECRDLIGKRYGEKYMPEKPNFYSSRKGAQEAHECIRPTHVEHAPDQIKKDLSDEQYKLYKLIWERFVACQMKPAIFDATSCDIAATGEKARAAVFRANGRVMKFDGWLAVYGGAATASHLEASAADREKGDETTDAEAGAEKTEGAAPKTSTAPKPAAKKRADQVLPAMKTGDHPDLKSLEPVQHFTQPPPRYTEASLVKMLEREGIGRPSTYATIISTLLDRGYVQKTGTGGRGSFIASALGSVVSDRLMGHFDHSIMDLGFTRKMESELDKIEEAHLDWRKVLSEFYDPFTDDMTAAARDMKATKGQAEKTDVKCPECGELMEKRLNRFGFYLRCSKAPECKGTLRLDNKGNIKEKEKPVATGIKCELCGSDVVKSVGRFGPYFHCVKYSDKQCTYTMKCNKEGQPIRKFKALPTDKICEKCKSPMVVRVTSRGKTRRPFLSCTGFPKCRAAMDLPPELAALGEQAMQQWRESDAKNKADLETYLATQAQQEAVAASGA
ncbi:MAG: type I DNA topoisomerase [Planctomycetes bacterium]|nr:type I DNA topoisomerase [Planctomycetota bacterium]